MDELMTSSDEESSLSSGSSELFSIGASYDVCRNPPQADSLSSEEVRSREILVRALLDADYDTLESLGPDALTTELHIMTRCACFVSPCSCYCSRAVEGLCNNIVTKSEFFEAITTGTCQPFHVDCVEIPHKLVGVVSQVIPKTIAELPSTYWASVWPIHIAVLVNNVELVQWILTRIKGKLVKPTICKDATTQQGNSANESKDTEDSYTQTPAQEHEGAHLALHDDAMDTSSSVPFYREETSENKRAKLAPDCCDRSDAANKDGAPVSALEVGTGNLGFTPLHLACFIRAADIVRLLLQNGAQVNVQSHATRQTPCAVAVTNMTKPGFVLRNEVIRILIEYGADINMGVDDAPIMKAVQCGDLQLVRTLVAAGVNQDISRFSPSTLLQRVQSSIRLFKVGMALLEGDALVNARSSDGNTPLQNALSAGDPFDQPLHQERLAFMRRLLEKGANPNDNDMPPLILALFTRLPEEAKLLLQFGANPQGKDRNGYQALHAAAWEGHTEICRLLIDKGFIPLTQVLIQMSRNTIQANNNNRKGSKGVETDEQTSDQNTPLSLAAHGNNTEILKLLLSLNCDVNNADKDGDTPLLYSTWNSNVEATRLLLEHGANVNCTNQAQTTPIWYAVRKLNVELVRLLLAHNARIDIASRGTHQNSGTLTYLYAQPKTPLQVLQKRIDLISGYNVETMHAEIQQGQQILQMLLLSGARLPALWDTVCPSLPRPLPLQCLARLDLRRILAGAALRKALPSLQLPNALKAYLLDMQAI